MLNEIVSLIQKCIRNKCVNPPGGELRSIRVIEDYLLSHGVKPEVFESAPDRGNLYAEIKGTGSRPSLMFGPSHVDVVPVEDESTWSVPPFEGIAKDNCIWGRGAFDMLFIVACQVVVFARLSENNFKPRGDLKLLVVSDEEAGGRDGIYWMIENQPAKTKSDYAVTEFGGIPVTPNRYTFFYGEKGASWMKMKFKGTEQHGSMPYGSNNAVSKMAKAIVRLENYQPEIDTAIIRRFMEGASIGGIRKFLITRKWLLPRMLRILHRRNAAQAKLFHSFSQMTISPNTCQGGTKVNVVPGSAEIKVDVRTLPGQDKEYVLRSLNEALGDLAPEAVIQEIPLEEGGFASCGSISNPKSELVGLMEQVLKEAIGEQASLVPMIASGGTDSRVLRKEFGTEAYGFSIISDAFNADELATMAHADNERIDLSSIELTAKAYQKLAERFLS